LLSDGLLIVMDAGKIMISMPFGQEQELLDNPDFNTVMEECMDDLLPQNGN
jgi:RNA polymerase sigma-70 factor (ECF subfamily)